MGYSFIVWMTGYFYMFHWSLFAHQKTCQTKDSIILLDKCMSWEQHYIIRPAYLIGALIVSILNGVPCRLALLQNLRWKLHFVLICQLRAKILIDQKWITLNNSHLKLAQVTCLPLKLSHSCKRVAKGTKWHLRPAFCSCPQTSPQFGRDHAVEHRPFAHLPRSERYSPFAWMGFWRPYIYRIRVAACRSI